MFVLIFTLWDVHHDLPTRVDSERAGPASAARLGKFRRMFQQYVKGCHSVSSSTIYVCDAAVKYKYRYSQSLDPACVESRSAHSLCSLPLRPHTLQKGAE
jgi:hypothetical protein